MRTLNDISVQYVKGVGPERKKLFERLGIESIEDLLYFFPRRYEDRRNLIPIKNLQKDQWQTVAGEVVNFSARRSWYGRKHVTEIVLKDKSGCLYCVFFNQPYLQHYFQKGRQVVCYGKADVYKDRLQMVSPEYEIIDDQKSDNNLNLKRIVPIYPLTKGITQRFLRKTVKACFDRYRNHLIDELPVALRNQYRLFNLKRSLNYLHFPEDFQQQEEALRRISFEEFYFYQISILLRRLSLTREKGVRHKIIKQEKERFIRSFPFTLTDAQINVLNEIQADMEKGMPMLRLLQGDVGCGKTIVALFGCMVSRQNGLQSCLMAPTEILARQHYETVQTLIAQGSLPSMNVALLVSGRPVKEKKETLDRIAQGKIDCVIATHAVINDEVQFKNLSFVVIDEQHKFGVRQRALLSAKGTHPDILIMTATPIPRTLCITLYGDLDLSVIDQMPPNRGKTKTLLFSHEQAQQVYELVKDAVKKGQQAYFIYPIIEESEKLDLKAAQDMYRQFQKKIFKGYSVGLIHGQMNRKESEQIMSDFKNKKIQILVATTVLEVGIDVASANVMVIEHAERFGLSQLHQLRGRIGRGQENALCIMISDPTTEDGKKRLQAILKYKDGFRVAQEDLLIRGPGSYFGRHQHGLNELKVANPVTQLDILKLAREEAVKLIGDDPQLDKDDHNVLRDIVRRRYPNYLAMVEAG